MAREWTYDLFISYVEADKAWVEGYLLDALQKAQINCTSALAFNLGVPSILEFQRAIQESRYTLLVISQAYLADELSQFTDILAQSYGEQICTWPIIPLILQAGLELPPRLKMLEGLKASSSQEWETALERLGNQLKQPIPPPSQKPDCPYPGMIPFSENDEGRFFGRDGEIEELLGKLRLHPFLTVIGASGSGKSSLVFAGLVPKLKRSGLFGTGQWCIRSLRPSSTPLVNLQTALGGDITNSEVTIKQLLSTQPDAQRLLLVVDQFEELFTQSVAEAISFQQSLLKLVEIPHVYLVLTIRADFYPDLMASALWDKIRAHRVEVLPLDREGLRQAIVRPAEGVDVYVDSALVERLLVDATGEPGVLPLIQETLVLLWEKLERHFLPIKAYELLILPRPAYGGTLTQTQTGLQVAIAHRADAAMADLETAAKQAIARRIFLRLVQFGEGRADTRRQQSIEALQAMGDDPVLFQTTLDHLVDSRLLTLSGKEDKAKSIDVDIAHEALIAGWPTFQQWISQQMEGEQTRRRLIEKATEWIRLGRGGGLLDRVELAEAEHWSTSSKAVDLGEDLAVSELMVASREAIQKTIKNEKRRNQTIISSICGTLIAFIMAGGFSLYQQEQSKKAIRNGSLNTKIDAPEMIGYLNDIFEDANREQNEEAIKSYKIVAVNTKKIQKEKLEDNQKNRVKSLYDKAEKSLVDRIQKYRIPGLKAQLSASPPKIGKYINGKDHSELQNQFTAGALQTSYQILIVDTGASLDTGLLENQERANLIPCLLLQQIEKIWRESSQEKCSFYGIDENGTNSVYVGNPGCVFGQGLDLSSTTLTKILIGYKSAPFFQERLKYCQVMRRDNS